MKCYNNRDKCPKDEKEGDYLLIKFEDELNFQIAKVVTAFTADNIYEFNIQSSLEPDKLIYVYLENRGWDYLLSDPDRPRNPYAHTRIWRYLSKNEMMAYL